MLRVTRTGTNPDETFMPAHLPGLGWRAARVLAAAEAEAAADADAADADDASTEDSDDAGG